MQGTYIAIAKTGTNGEGGEGWQLLQAKYLKFKVSQDYLVFQALKRAFFFISLNLGLKFEVILFYYN